MSHPAPSLKLQDRVSPDEWQARVDLAAAHRLAVLRGWQPAYSLYNHISVRVPGSPDEFLLKPHNLLFGEVTASNLLKLNVNEPKSQKDNVNGAGFAIHAGILKARADINAAVHLHTVAGQAVSALERGFMHLTQESMLVYGQLGYHRFEGIARLDEQERIMRDLGERNMALVLNNHGLLMCGASVAEATMIMGDLINAAEVQLAVLATGEKVIEPSRVVCEETARTFEQFKQSTRDDWEAVLRWLDRQDSSFRA
jgi:ribulose-5-phosphate 4-epimerase/fuculose-1-phosphate aldolase